MIHNGVGFAHGKVILMGEHAVVHGKPAIALPFHGAQVVVNAQQTDGPSTIHSSYYNGMLADVPLSMRGIQTLIEACLDFLERPNQGIVLNIDSSLPANRGLGSSAAVSVAIVRSLFALFKQDIDDDTLMLLVNVAETIHHHNPSGLDVNAVVGGRPLYFVRPHGKSEISLNTSAYIVVADTGELGSTRDAVVAFSETLAQGGQMHEALDRIGFLTDKTRLSLQYGNIYSVGQAMNEVHDILRDFSVSSPSLDHLVNTARRNGALGAKLTGSGKGGCMIALVTDEQQAQAMMRALSAEGAVQTWSYRLEGDDA